MKNAFKEYDSENSSESDSDSSNDVTEIEDYLYLDDEQANNFISTDINEKNLQKFLQQEMDFYRKAFPQEILMRKSSRYVRDLLIC